jgi:DNA repair protein RecO (recombination protein O)
MATSNKGPASSGLGRGASSRILDEPAFVLHSIAYKETSLVVELLTRNHGRVPVIAKGAKRPHSALRATLLAFQPLQVAWQGKQDLRNLIRAEWIGGLASPRGDALLCAFYLNELLVRLLPRDDPHPEVFDTYLNGLARFASGEPVSSALRRVEWNMLKNLGYAPDLKRDHHGQMISSEKRYQLGAAGLVQAGSEGISGRIIELMADESWDDPAVWQPGKILVRQLLNRALDGQALNTRQILIDLNKL